MSQELFGLAGRLLGGVIADQRAQAMAQRERIAARPKPSQFRPVTPPLPPEGWHDGPRCQFAYPWGWEELDLTSLSDAQEEVVFALQPQRYDGDVASIRALQVEQCSREELLDAAAILEDERAKALRLTSLAPMSYVSVAGEPGLVVQLHGRPGPQATANIVLTEVFTVNSRRLYNVQLVATERDHPAYLQVLWTVIGTWSWR
jgi:hypothetical protein